MDISEVLASGLELDGIPLSLASNEGLLRWPGNWVAHGRPYYPKQRLANRYEQQYQYPQYEAEAPVGRHLPPPAPVPDEPVSVWRARVRTGETTEPNQNGYARPHAAACWDAAQALSSQQENPYNRLLEQIELPRPRPDLKDTSGAAWLLAQVSLPLLKTALLRPAAVARLSPAGAAQALTRYLVTNHGWDEIRVVLLQVKKHDLEPMTDTVNRKLSQIRNESERWIEAARPPVIGLDGQVDHPLTLANAATVAVAIQLLDCLQTRLVSFRHSAWTAYHHLVSFPQTGRVKSPVSVGKLQPRHS